MLIFCRRATLLSDNFYTICGANTSRLIDGILKIYYTIFNAISATLKFGSPNNLISIGRMLFITTSISIYCFDIWNLVWNYSIASSLVFQSLSFLRSYNIFLPITCYSFYCFEFWPKIGGNIKLDYLLRLFYYLSWFLTDFKFKEYCNSLPELTPNIDSALRRAALSAFYFVRSILLCEIFSCNSF